MRARKRSGRRADQTRSEAGAAGPVPAQGLSTSSIKSKVQDYPWSSKDKVERVAIEITRSIGQDPRIADKSFLCDPSIRQSVLRVSPGIVQVSDIKPADPYALAKLMNARTKDQIGRDCIGGNKRRITEFSRSSRRSLITKFLKVDFTPLVEQGSVVAMITLTYPGDWETVAYSGNVIHDHLEAFGERFKSAFGYKLCYAWKMEFQRRGAPHFHIFMAVPDGLAYDRRRRNDSGTPFPQWLSQTWADIVNHPDPGEKERHIRAGTGIDSYGSGWTSFDIRKVAWYFAKHGAYKGGKEYQHLVPDIIQKNGGPGRFWGFVGLKPVTVEIPIKLSDKFAIDRIIRRYFRSRGRRYRATYRNRSSLWIDDAPEIAAIIARHLETGPRHVIRTSLVSEKARQRHWARSVSFVRQAVHAWTLQKHERRRRLEFLDAYFQQEFGDHLIEHPLWLGRAGLVSHPIYRELIQIELRGNRLLKKISGN